jgi:CheY-like chemotaxis protein
LHRKIRRALVFEDSKPMRDIIRIALTSCGCGEIIEVDNGALAFGSGGLVDHHDIPTDGATDLIFMDWFMPGMDGIACTKLIRSGALDGFDAQVPIIMLTGHDTVDAERVAREAGVTAFLRKPVKMKVIFAALTQILNANVPDHMPLTR